jgi:hypothetical protein
MKLFRRLDFRLSRNLEIFWAVRRDGRAQGEVAVEHGLTQQRVCAIVRKMALYVAMAPSEMFEGLPQMVQLQYARRMYMASLESRRKNVARAFEASLQGVSSFRKMEGGKMCASEEKDKPAKGTYKQWREEEAAKTQHGDWRLDRQLEGIDKALLEGRICLYGRNWRGFEELEQSGMVKRRRKAEGGEGKADVARAEGGGVKAEAEAIVAEPYRPVVFVEGSESLMRSTERRSRDGAVADLAVPSTDYLVPVTELAAPAVVVESVPEVVETQPAVAAEVPVAGTSKKRPRSERPKPISKLTGKLLDAPRLQSPECLRAHGLDPADYDGGNHFDTTPVWMTGPDPAIVLSRNTDFMTREELDAHNEDLAIMWLLGSYNSPVQPKSKKAEQAKRQR